jgi:hypothetical protein
VGAADEAAIRRDDQVVGAGMHRFADQQFLGVRTVDVGGIDRGHASVDGLSQQRDPAVKVGVFAPASRSLPILVAIRAKRLTFRTTKR